ncbi:MAG TPA: hypothetical protein VEP66_17905 [Myxococcales bacterium]|nr:hypothetical protein [Myxococcales bacterium]
MHSDRSIRIFAAGEEKIQEKLQVTDSTAVTKNGQSWSAAQLQAGADVRARYQKVDGQAKALKIDVTSKSSEPAQPSSPQKY